MTIFRHQIYKKGHLVVVDKHFNLISLSPEKVERKGMIARDLTCHGAERRVPIREELKYGNRGEGESRVNIRSTRSRQKEPRRLLTSGQGTTPLAGAMRQHDGRLRCREQRGVCFEIDSIFFGKEHRPGGVDASPIYQRHRPGLNATRLPESETKISAPSSNLGSRRLF